MRRGPATRGSATRPVTSLTGERERGRATDILADVENIEIDE